jgi:hypothetical protein
VFCFFADSVLSFSSYFQSSPVVVLLEVTYLVVGPGTLKKCWKGILNFSVIIPMAYLIQIHLGLGAKFGHYFTWRKQGLTCHIF